MTWELGVPQDHGNWDKHPKDQRLICPFLVMLTHTGCCEASPSDTFMAADSQESGLVEVLFQSGQFVEDEPQSATAMPVASLLTLVKEVVHML